MKLDRPVSRLDVDGAADAHEKRGARPSLARLRATEPHLHRFLQAKAEGLVKDLARRGVTDGATFANASDAVHSAGMVAADAVKRSREFRHSAGPAKLATGGGAGQGGSAASGDAAGDDSVLIADVVLFLGLTLAVTTEPPHTQLLALSLERAGGQIDQPALTVTDALMLAEYLRRALWDGIGKGCHEAKRRLNAMREPAAEASAEPPQPSARRTTTPPVLPPEGPPDAVNSHSATPPDGSPPGMQPGRSRRSAGHEAEVRRLATARAAAALRLLDESEPELAASLREGMAVVKKPLAAAGVNPDVTEHAFCEALRIAARTLKTFRADCRAALAAVAGEEGLAEFDRALRQRRLGNGSERADPG